MHHSISSVARNADALAAVWSGGERTELPYLWLRDNCGCSECRVVQTTEKRFHIFRVAGDLKPLQVGIERAGSEDEGSRWFGRTGTEPATGQARSTAI